MSQDSSYYLARIQEERSRAMAATDPRVRRAHLELAVEYAALASANDLLADNEELASLKRQA